MYMDNSTIPYLFDSEVYNEVWGNQFGVDNAVGKVKKIIVHKPSVELKQLKDGEYIEGIDARILSDEKGRIRK